MIFIVVLIGCTPVSITQNMNLQSPPAIKSHTYTGNLLILPFNYGGTTIALSGMTSPSPFSRFDFSKLDPAYPVNLFNERWYTAALVSDDYSFTKRFCVSSKERAKKIANAIVTSIVDRINKTHIFVDVMFHPDITSEELLNDKKVKEYWVSKGYYFVLIGTIKYFYAAEPVRPSAYGGPDESNIAFAHTKFDNLELIDICNGVVIWKGSVEGKKLATRETGFGVAMKRHFLENKDSVWVDLDKLQLETLNQAINNLVLKLSKIKLPPPEKIGCKQ